MSDDRALVLERLAGVFGVLRLPPGSLGVERRAELGALSEAFFSLTQTAEEASVVASMSALSACCEGLADGECELESDFVLYRVAGTLDFSLTGILSRLLDPLAEERISVFALSTYDTDWIMVPVARANDAEAAWSRASFQVAAS